MIDMSSTQEVMELLKIFLAARSRGKDAVLILETRRKTISTKYRTAENAAGAPAATNTPALKKRRKNPARARRSKLRLEEFTRKKVEEKEPKTEKDLNRQAVGDTSCKSNKLVLELPSVKDKSVGTSLPSPMLKVDGDKWRKVKGSTSSSVVAEDDIAYTLDEIFQQEVLNLSLCNSVLPEVQTTSTVVANLVPGQK